MKCCYIWLLIILSILVLILGFYIFSEEKSLKVIIPICSLILVLGICAVVASYNNSKGKEFATFYKEVIKIKSDNTSDATNNQDNSNDVTLTDNHIKVLKVYADLLKEK